MEIKLCKKCLLEKNLDEYKKYSGNLCEGCYRIDTKERVRLSREKHRVTKMISDIRTCKKCNIVKDNLEYYKGRNICKLCFNEDRKLKKIEEIKNVIKIKTAEEIEYLKIKKKEINKKWVCNNKEKVKEINKKWRNKNKNKYNEYTRKYTKERRNGDSIFKLSSNIRSLIFKAFKNSGYIKESKTFEIIGCSPEYLREYIETQFLPWMNWDNHGKYNGEFDYGWDIDHIEPLFPKGVERTAEDIIRLNHYTNLQPLCSKINRDIKSNNKM